MEQYREAYYDLYDVCITNNSEGGTYLLCGTAEGEDGKNYAFWLSSTVDENKNRHWSLTRDRSHAFVFTHEKDIRSFFGTELADIFRSIEEQSGFFLTSLRIVYITHKVSDTIMVNPNA